MTRYVMDQWTSTLDYPTLGFTADPNDILIATAAPDGRWSVNGNQSAAETVTRYAIGVDPSYVEPTDGHVLTWSDAGNAYVPTAPVNLLDDAALAADLSATIAARAVPRITGPIIHVILVAGQSNAAPLSSQAVPTTEVSEPRLLEWVVSGTGAQTIVTMPASRAYIGAWAARDLLAKLPVDHYVLVVPTGVGSTGFTEQTATVDGVSVTCSWDPANTTAAVNLYDRMTDNFDAAVAAALALDLGQTGAPTLAYESMIWSQGENDRTMTKAQYTTAVTDMIAAWRTHTGDSTYPITVGSMTPELFVTSPENTLPIELALQDLPATVSRVAYTPGPKDQTNWVTNPWDPVSNSGGDKSQLVHWSAQGQRTRAGLFVDGNYRAKLNETTTDPRTPRGLRGRWVGGTLIEVEWEPSQSRVTSYDCRYALNGATQTKTVRGMGPLSTKVLFEIAPTTSLSMQTVRVQVRSNNEVGPSFWSDWVEVGVPSNFGSPGLDLTGGGFFWSALGVGLYGDEITTWNDLRAGKTLAGTGGTSPLVAAGPDGGQVLRFATTKSLVVAALGATFKSVAIVCKIQNLTATAGILSAGAGDMAVSRNNTTGTLDFSFIGAGATSLTDTSTKRADGVTQTAGDGKWAQNWMTVVVSSSADITGLALANTVSGSAASVATGFTDLTIGLGQIDVRAVYAYNGSTAKTAAEMATAVAMAKASYARLFASPYPAVS